MSSDFPLRLGLPEPFPIIRNFLESSGYTEEFLRSHFHLPSIHFLLYPYGLQAEYLNKKYEEGDSLPLFLARLFIAGRTYDRPALEERLTSPVVAALEQLGLLIPGDTAGLRCPVIVYPALGVFVASDRGFRPEGPGYRGKDYVMSGTEHICRQFIAHISRAPCKTFLDMGTGSGLAALLATKFSEQVWAVDITPRAASYAGFNRLLNGAQNLTVLEGDLFTPVRGLSFDRIASNPPFEPPLKDGMIFSVGGEDGEAIIKRLVTEIPPYLNPGGRLYCQVCGTDRENESFDERILSWLGEARSEFDAVLFVRLTLPPNEYAIQQMLGENQDSWKLQEWNMFYHKLKATQVVIGHLILQKRASVRPTFTARRNFGPVTTQKEIEWLLDWETQCAGPDFADRLLESRPRPGLGWELHVRHGLQEGKLTPLGYTFFTTYPFETNLHVASWMAMLVSRCDGKATAAGHYQFFASRMTLSKEEYLRALGALIGADFLRIDGFEPPASPEAAAQ
ncbi:MAG: Release factor glutamine methyltransferase [Bryobacteraceae bacterium]|nr:Release factor glutamine methyltransferase [Bryobacteraceae bacterium]